MKILTFDIEEWFHILDNNSTKSESSWQNFETRIHSNIDRILSLLSHHDKKATFFCLGWIAAKHPDVIKDIHKNGHEIGSHSHLHQLVFEQKPKEFKADLITSIDTLENIIGAKVKLYRSPGFSITKQSLWAFEILAETGIECDCSIFPAHRNHGGMSDFPYREPFQLNVNGSYIKEFPMSVFPIGQFKIPFSGGGYFRLLPYSLIRRMVSKSQYLMTYFHPRDFDENQPMIKDLPYSRKFRSYYGLSNSYKKLGKFLLDYDFISVTEAIEKINWDNVPIHKINLVKSANL